MLSLILSKIQAGKVDLELRAVSVEALCKASLCFIRQQALQKQVQLRLDIAPNLGTIQVDERRIRQVLINLLSNAVKFTPEGGQVTLEVRIDTASSSALSYLCFCVIDTGIGIAPEDLSKLFQPFVQFDSRLSRQFAGTGLGLALLHRLVELHGGKVSVTSTPHEGSCFMVRLPQTSAKAAKPEAAIASENEVGARISLPRSRLPH